MGPVAPDRDETIDYLIDNAKSPATTPGGKTAVLKQQRAASRRMILNTECIAALWPGSRIALDRGRHDINITHAANQAPSQPATQIGYSNIERQ